MKDLSFQEQIILDEEQREKISIRAINARILLLSYKGECKQEKIFNSISNLKFYNKKKLFHTISLQDIINIKYKESLTGVDTKGFGLTKYLINSIIQESPIEFRLSEELLTKTSEFILPSLIPSSQLCSWNTYFMNSFIYRDKKGRDNLDSESNIYLLYRRYCTDSWIELDSYLCKHKNYLYDETLDRNRHLYCFSIPDLSILNIFIDGKYSKFSEEYKNKILNFRGLHKNSTLGNILYQNDKYREQLSNKLGGIIEKDAELLSIPDLTKETIYE